MEHYDIEFKITGDAMTAICAAIRVAKSLNVDHLCVKCKEGFNISVSQESRAVDVFNIYQLTAENAKLKSSKAKQ